MENIVYLFGILAIFYMIYLLYNKYERSNTIDFNKKALLAIMLYNTEPVRIIYKKIERAQTPHINYLLSNVISITDTSLSEAIKNEYYRYCSSYIDQAYLEIRKFSKTNDGTAILKREIERYKHLLENQLKKDKLTDLRLRENRLKYLEDLNEIIDEKQIYISDFIQKVSNRMTIDISDAEKLAEDLKNSDSGLIFYSDGLVYLKANASGGQISNLDKEIFRNSHQLSILANINLNEL